MASAHRLTVDQLQAAYCRLKSYCGRHATSGRLTHDQALTLARPRVLEALAARPLADQQPMLHRRGDECDCLPDEWPAGYDYLMHAFLTRNPNKKEHARYRAQKAERQDPAVRARVYHRDAGCCRYCRSGPLKRSGMGRARDRRRVIQYDHVDPDALAGDDLANLVVACARCNESKGNRTPDEADMALLPEPAALEREQWLARPEELLTDPPAHPRRQRANSASTALSTADRTAVTTAVDTAVPLADPQADHTGDDCPKTGCDQHGQTPDPGCGGAGSGRGGQRGAVGSEALGQPARRPEAPDIYHRRSRAPAREPPSLRDPPPLDDHLPDLEGEA